MYQYVQIPSASIIPQLDQTCNMKWIWAPRNGTINWDLLEALDIDNIVRTGNLKAVEFYVQPLISANITNADAKKFGSRAALNAFMLMQLAVDYLLTQAHNYSLGAVIAEQQERIKAQAEFAEKYQQTSVEMQKKLQEKDETIKSLEKEIEALNRKLTKQKSKVKRLKKEISMRQEVHKFRNKVDVVQPEAYEPGLITAHEQFSTLEKLQRTAELRAFGETKIPHKIANESLSDGEIDIETLSRLNGRL